MNETESDGNQAILTLGTVSRLSGIPPHSIRQYMERGLLIPFKRENKRHLFSMNDVRRLKHIHYLIQEKGLNFAGIKAMLSMIPCWEYMKCANTVKQQCKAYLTDSQPCWEASEKSVACKNINCRECVVYACLSNSADLKSELRN